MDDMHSVWKDLCIYVWGYGRNSREGESCFQHMVFEQSKKHHGEGRREHRGYEGDHVYDEYTLYWLWGCEYEVFVWKHPILLAKYFRYIPGKLLKCLQKYFKLQCEEFEPCIFPQWIKLRMSRKRSKEQLIWTWQRARGHQGPSLAAHFWKQQVFFWGEWTLLYSDEVVKSFSL